MATQEINRYWEKIVNTMNDGLILIGPDGIITRVNRALERLLGYPAEELVGRPCTLFHCDACERTLRDDGRWWCTLFATGKEISKRCLFVKKNGTCLQVLKNASVLQDDNGRILGAVETITDLSEIERLDEVLSRLSRQLADEDGFHGIIGNSEVIRNVFQVIEKAAQSDAPVAIYGESGTGKELVARAIHQLGKRNEGPFIQLNCAALNESLLESELFGHVKGAFTGAYSHRVGRFEAADRGDIFLDEIGEVPLSIQVKLLRVLETKQFERVGDQRPISSDVRIITATNKNLVKSIAQKKFREDLFYRINVIPIHLPPLRTRLEDIPLLAEFFMTRLRSKTGKAITGLTPAAMKRLMVYPWPGNVRELKSALEYAFVICERGLIEPGHLPPHISVARVEDDLHIFMSGNVDPDEKTLLINALQQSMGNQSQAARILNISRGTVWNRMRKYGLDLKKVMTS